MLFYYIFTVCYVITLIDVDFYMSAQRNFDTKDILFLLSKEALSTGDVAKQIRCSRITALKYLKELKAEKRVKETRISNTSNVWQLNFDNQILIGDCAETLKNIETDSIDLIVTDPPYGISFIGHDWDKSLPSVLSLKECCRVLKPGAFGFFMCSPRQDVMPRMILRLEDAGFKTGFTSIFWVYTHGMPRGNNISTIIDKMYGVEREVIGKAIRPNSCLPNHKSGGKHGMVYDITAPTTEEAKALDGAYPAFNPKPATEPILVVMKPLSAKSYTAQALENGKGITWLGNCKIPYADDNDKESASWGTQKYIDDDSDVQDGRFPANILVSDDTLGDSSRFFDLDKWFKENLPKDARKTYPALIVPKPTPAERNKYAENIHPTVKPLKLMSYLITMGSREGDLVLDPFAGSGTTLEAANTLKRRFIGCELDPQWKPVIEARAYMRTNTVKT